MRVIVQRIRAIAEDHNASGGTADEWAEALGMLANPVALAQSAAPVYLPTLETFAALLEAWHTGARWLDKSGNPRPLVQTGPRGFAGLSREVGVGRKARSLIALGLAEGVLQKNRRGRLVPTDRTALVRRQSPMFMELLGVGLAAWQSTIRHNLSPKTPKSARRLERGIYFQPIPKELEAEFHRFARNPGSQWIHGVDNWLQAHRAPPGHHPVVYVGAQAFTFSHATTPVRPKRRRRRRG
ncbi:MAG TPA: DUF6502 family protein [Gemmatimonadales bacterium]|nr:DUF6502 family protein [Gemmatimonadales bacterium]